MTINLGESSETGSIEYITFPPDKEGIAALIAEGTLAAAVRQGFLDGAGWTLTKNGENDFEFSLRNTEGTNRYIELTEFGRRRRAPDCDCSHLTCIAGDVAFAICRQMWRKSHKYQGATSVPMDLVVYTTDWRFVPTPPIQSILKFRLATHVLCFSRLFTYLPVTIGRDVPGQIYPARPRELEDYAPACESVLLYILNLMSLRNGDVAGTADA